MGNSTGNSWAEGRSIMRSRVVQDPTVKAELHTWLSAAFREEHALTYTSLSNPAKTCIYHCRVNRYKVLLTIHDCLCEGNTVRVEMKFVGERDNYGYFAVRYADAHDSSGSFVEKVNLSSGYSLWKYQDKFKRRIGELELQRGDGEYDVRFTSGIRGDTLLTYYAHVICDPLKGLRVDFSGPNCEYDDYARRPLGLCYLNRVPSMPTHDVGKETKQGNDVGAPLGSTLTTKLYSKWWKSSR